MKSIKSVVVLFMMFISTLAFANDTHSTPVLRGYDAVSYHTIGRPVMGNGGHLSEYNGEVYLFITDENKDMFDKNPAKYAPAYGGWCAFGVTAGKKFHGDPLVWEIIDGKLYVNLNNKVKGLWIKDIPGNITKANKVWETIKNKPVSSL
jgi:YHS domain-containing protein